MDWSLRFPKIGLLLFPVLASALTSGVHSHDRAKVFDVRSFGAIADGKTDDSKDITMKDVLNPIIIDQEYCPNGGCSKQPGSNVRIDGVLFTEIRGTSASEVAVSLVCSPNSPCENIDLHDIDLTCLGSGGPAKSRCAHVNGRSGGMQNPLPCVRHR